MLHYHISGHGPVWVLLHGFLESSTMWRVLPLSKLPITTLFIDLPGHGKSGLKNDNPSIAKMAQEVGKVLEFLQIEKFNVIGHSMGAYVGLELSNQPGFQKLILLNSNCWSDTEQKKQDRLRVATIVQKAKKQFIREAIPNLFSEPSDHESFIKTLIQEANSMSAQAISHSALAMRERKDYTEFVGANPEKYVFIHGNLDKLVGLEELKSKVKHSEIYVLNCGHMAHVEAGAELMKLLYKITCPPLNL